MGLLNKIEDKLSGASKNDSNYAQDASRTDGNTTSSTSGTYGQPQHDNTLGSETSRYTPGQTTTQQPGIGQNSQQIGSKQAGIGQSGQYTGSQQPGIGQSGQHIGSQQPGIGQSSQHISSQQQQLGSTAGESYGTAVVHPTTTHHGHHGHHGHHSGHHSGQTETYPTQHTTGQTYTSQTGSHQPATSGGRLDQSTGYGSGEGVGQQQYGSDRTGTGSYNDASTASSGVGQTSTHHSSGHHSGSHHSHHAGLRPNAENPAAIPTAGGEKVGSSVVSSRDYDSAGTGAQSSIPGQHTAGSTSGYGSTGTSGAQSSVPGQQSVGGASGYGSTGASSGFTGNTSSSTGSTGLTSGTSTAPSSMNPTATAGATDAQGLPIERKLGGAYEAGYRDAVAHLQNNK